MNRSFDIRVSEWPRWSLRLPGLVSSETLTHERDQGALLRPQVKGGVARRLVRRTRYLAGVDLPETIMSARKVWMSSPHSGGNRIPPAVQLETRQRILKHAATHYAGRYSRIDVRFRGALCYIDAYCEPDPPGRDLLAAFGETEQQYYQRLRETPIHLCRIRYFAGRHQWSLAFYTYSHERYEATFFPDGAMFGTPEAAFDVGAMYLL